MRVWPTNGDSPMHRIRLPREGYKRACRKTSQLRGLGEVDFAGERQIPGTGSGQKRIAAGNELPAVGVLAVDRKIFDRDLDCDLPAFAGIQMQLVPAYQALGRLAGVGGKRSI